MSESQPLKKTSQHHLKKKKKNDGDEEYYDKHNNHAVPRTIIKRIVMDFIKQKKGLRVDKKAIDILHFEIEKYIIEIFITSGCMLDASQRHTLQASFFKKATKLHEALRRSH